MDKCLATTLGPLAGALASLLPAFCQFLVPSRQILWVWYRMVLYPLKMLEVIQASSGLAFGVFAAAHTLNIYAASFSQSAFNNALV
jgi:hypothetical protein